MAAELHYGSKRYEMSEDSASELMDRIESAITKGEAFWHSFDRIGVGGTEYILIAPGIPIRIVSDHD